MKKKEQQSRSVVVRASKILGVTVSAWTTSTVPAVLLCEVQEFVRLLMTTCE